MSTSAKCLTCGAVFSGSREETFQWLWYHRTLHGLQATAVQRFASANAHSRLVDRRAVTASAPRAA